MAAARAGRALPPAAANLNQPEKTAETLRDGWLHTGDVGYLDNEGYLKITDRMKDIIITAGGKNVVPAVLEDRLREHWLIEECVVVGDQRPYIAALVTLDQEAFARWKRRQGKPASATAGVNSPRLRSASRYSRSSECSSTPGTPHSFIIRHGDMPVPPPAASTVSRSISASEAYFTARARSAGR